MSMNKSMQDTSIKFGLTPMRSSTNTIHLNQLREIHDSDQESFEINIWIDLQKEQLELILDGQSTLEGQEEVNKPYMQMQDSVGLSSQNSLKHKFKPNVVSTLDSHFMIPHKSNKSDTCLNSKLPMLQPYTMSIQSSKFFKINRFSKFGGHNEEVLDPNDKAKENQLIKNMEESFELKYQDKPAPEVIGEQAEKKYYQHYKKIDSILQSKVFELILNYDSIQTSMLSQAVSQNVIPCKIGIIKLFGDDTSLKIANQRYGDQYASILTEGLKYYPSVKDYELSNNRIKATGASALLTQIAKNARSIEIQQNSIGSLGIDAICQSLAQKESKIEILNLEDNRLGNHNVLRLLKGLSNNSSLKSLNLSKNFLSSHITEALKNYISGNDHLEELYLFWNQIKGNGGSTLMDGLLLNDSLIVLDLSWNSLGVDSPSCVIKICDYLRKNKSVCHMDLSSNFFTQDQCKSIAESLKLNKSIFGFHFAGNYGYVDARGFLITDETMANTPQITGTSRINGLKQTHYSGVNSRDSVHLKNVCWICQGWQEHEFQWKNNDVDQDPVFVHLQCEGYSPIYIPRKIDGSIALKLMVPPMDTRYFYTIAEDQSIDQESTIIDLPQNWIQKIKFSYTMMEVSLERMNLMSKLKHFSVIDAGSLQTTVGITPRTPDTIYVPPKLQKVKRIWVFAMSIWAKDFKFDTEEILRKCFEKDWACSKVTKVVRNVDDQNLVKETLWQNYKAIKETYKFYSSYNPNGDIWSISSNPITEFTQSCELLDNKTLKLSDLDLKFIATCSASLEYKGNLRNPERALCRFQFMEFLVRLSEDKYLKNKIAQNFPEAIEMLLNQCNKVMSQCDEQKWRNDRYFTEQCDDVCKNYKQLMNNVYNRFSKKKVKPGQKNFMCLEELRDICNLCGFFEENFGERDCNMAFNLSMLTQVDELEVDRIFQMSLIEFMEAMARVAEKLSPTALEADLTQDWSYEKRFAQPLHLKLEKLMVMLASKTTNVTQTYT